MREPKTKQMEYWAGGFGRDYTERNAFSQQEMNDVYYKLYGTTRTEMNSRFIADLDREMRVLEVGSNVGDQLVCLQNDGFKHLYGIELQRYAVDLSKNRTRGIDIIEGNAFDVPFKDAYFDLVFTSGVLIHIAPEDIGRALDELFRCTKRYIWCLEYYADVYTSVDYQGHANLLWKANFSSLFLERFSSLRLIKEEHFKYLDNDNVDIMFLLEKSA